MLEETDFQLTYNCLFSYNYYNNQTACPDVTSGHAFKNANQILLKQRYYETYY